MRSFKQFLYESKIHVPQFNTTEEAEEFIAALGIDDTVDGLVVDPFTGEVLMRPGDTRRAKMKSSAQKKIDSSGSPPMLLPFSKDIDHDHWAEEQEFLDFYHVVFKDLSDEVDNPQAMRDADYDVDVDYPKVIKRKDGKEFTEDDVLNIESFLEFKQYNLPHGIKMTYNIRAGKTIAQIVALFV